MDLVIIVTDNDVSKENIRKAQEHEVPLVIAWSDDVQGDSHALLNAASHLAHAQIRIQRLSHIMDGQTVFHFHHTAVGIHFHLGKMR